MIRLQIKNIYFHWQTTPLAKLLPYFLVTVNVVYQPWTPFWGTGPLFRRSAIPKVHCADTRHSANVWVKVKVNVRVRVKIRVRVIGLGSALRLGLVFVGMVDFRNSGPDSILDPLGSVDKFKMAATMARPGSRYRPYFSASFAAQLGRIDTSQLDELERELSGAETRLEDARIEQRYGELEELSTLTSTWITDYGHQLTVLLQDVENIRKINETIPRECFRKIILEPADPRG